MPSAPRHTQMPDHLANLTPPTRQDAIKRATTIRRLRSLPCAWEETNTARQMAKGVEYPADFVAARRRDFDAEWENAIADAMTGLKRIYAHDLERKRGIEEDNEAAFTIEREELRHIYLGQPGSTERDFDAALPSLLAAKRQQATLSPDTETQRYRSQMRAKLAI